jgi:hypothetical protein
MLNAAVWTAGPTRRRSTFPAHPEAEIATTGRPSASSTAPATQTTPGGGLLVFIGDAVDGGPPELLPQHVGVPNCSGSDRHQSGGDRLLDHVWARGRQQRLADAGGMGGEPTADLGRQAGRVFATQYLHIDDFDAIQYCEGGSSVRSLLADLP